MKRPINFIALLVSGGAILFFLYQILDWKRPLLAFILVLLNAIPFFCNLRVFFGWDRPAEEKGSQKGVKC